MSSPEEIYGMPTSEAADYENLRWDVIRRRWDQKARRWDSDLADPSFHLNVDGAYDRFLEAAEEVIAARADFCRHNLLVDLACGTGLVLARFVDRFARGQGIDFSAEMLAVAEGRQLARAEFRQGNCFTLAGLVSEAGMVLSRGILLSHYGRRLVPVLWDQIRRALRPEGGVAMLDYLNAAARHEYPASPENKTYYDAAEMEGLASAAGFRRATTLGDSRRRVRMILAES